MSSQNYIFSPVPKISNLVGEIVRYLQESHEYYTTTALVTLSSSIESMIAPCSQTQKTAIWRFFTDYKSELSHHFEYEECDVIPYIQSLLDGKRDKGYSIDVFEDHHSSIDEKLSDLGRILRKTLQDDDSREEEKERLFAFMDRLREDIARHSYIEDEVMVPLVRMLEKMSPSLVKNPAPRISSNQEEELSEREKEILISVAMGLMNKEIADKHNISINTVITHRKNITRKTGIKTTAGLTVYAILNNLVDVNSVIQ